MEKKIVNILSSGNIVIPLYLMSKYKELGIDMNEFIMLMYIHSLGNNSSFNPNLISKDLGIDMKEVMELISNLSEKHLIELKVIKVDKKEEEVISLDMFYDKLALILKGAVAEESKDNSTIFDFIEKEFARTLSPMEYEIIKAWLENGNSEELIEEAVKEATFNGVNNLRYIDKILYEWDKKGIKSKDDVEKNRKNFRKKEEKEELFDYNWFEDEDE